MSRDSSRPFSRWNSSPRIISADALFCSACRSGNENFPSERSSQKPFVPVYYRPLLTESALSGLGFCHAYLI
jgi:hypothetical protein